MVNSFFYQGGAVKPTEHTLEKFLLFFLVNNMEVPLSIMLREGLVHRSDEHHQRYTTSFDIGKVFMGFQGFGLSKFYHSFYFQLRDVGPRVQIHPYTTASQLASQAIKRAGGRTSIFMFSAVASFLRKEEVLPLLFDNVSRGFLERQNPLASDLLNRLLTVDRTEEKRDVRKIRIGRVNKPIEEEDDIDLI